VTAQLNDLETRAAGTRRVDGLAADLETVDGRIDDIPGDTRGEIATLDDDFDSIAEWIDDVDAGTNETAVTGLEDDVSAIADRLESLRTDHELVRTVESSPDESAVQALEEVRTLDSDMDSPERADGRGRQAACESRGTNRNDGDTDRRDRIHRRSRRRNRGAPDGTRGRSQRGDRDAGAPVIDYRRWWGCGHRRR